MPEIQFNIPLPIIAIISFIGGAIYKIWKLQSVVKAINKNQAEAINKSYKNVFFK